MAINNPVVTDSEWLQAAAVEIQNKDGGGKIEVPDFASRIKNIPSGSTLIPKTITENGVYNASSDNADGYSSVEVNVADKWVGLIDNTISGEVVIPDGVTTIPDSKFENCSLVTKVIMPDTITSIGNNAFRDCHLLSEVKLSSNTSIIGDNAFRDCTSLTELEIPPSVTSIKSYCCYNGNLSSLILHSGLLTLGQYCFAGNRMTNIIIPDSVVKIGQSCFFNCRRCEYIDCTALTYTGTDVNTVLSGRYVFDNTNNCSIIFADEATMNVYKNATNWSAYASRMTYVGAE